MTIRLNLVALAMSLASTSFLLAQEFRHVTYMASVLSGQMRSNAGISVKANGSDPIIVPTDRLTDANEVKLGNVWQLVENQELSFHFTLPKGAQDCRIQLLACGMSQEVSTLAVKLNDEKYQHTSIASLRKSKDFLALDIDLEALKCDQDQDSVNTFRISSGGGLVGIQSVKVTFRAPLPQILFGPNNSAEFALIEPIFTVYAAKREPITIRWTVSNAPASAFVNLAYKRKDGRLFPIVTALPIAKCLEAKTSGDYTWELPDSITDSIDIVADPFVVSVSQADGVIYKSDGRIVDFAVSKDFRTAIVVEDVNSQVKARILDISTGRARQAIDIPDGNRVARNFFLTDDGQYTFMFQMRAEDQDILIFRNSDGKLIAKSDKIKPPKGNLINFPFIQVSTGERIALTSRGIVAWDMESFTYRQVIDYQDRFVVGIDVALDGKSILVTTASEDWRERAFALLDLETQKELWSISGGYDTLYTDMKFTPDGNSILATTFDSKEKERGFTLLSVSTGVAGEHLVIKARNGEKRSEPSTGSLRVSPDGTAVAFRNGGQQEQLCLMELSTGNIVHEFGYASLGYFFSPDGKFLLIWTPNDQNEIVIKSIGGIGEKPPKQK